MERSTCSVDGLDDFTNRSNGDVFRRSRCHHPPGAVPGVADQFQIHVRIVPRVQQAEQVGIAIGILRDQLLELAAVNVSKIQKREVARRRRVQGFDMGSQHFLKSLKERLDAETNQSSRTNSGRRRTPRACAGKSSGPTLMQKAEVNYFMSLPGEANQRALSGIDQRKSVLKLPLN
jgi:hypothetical protein